MPWTLAYPDDIDGRITRNAHRALFAESPDVESLSVRAYPQPRLVVAFRNEGSPTADTALWQVYNEYGVRDVTLPVEPLLQRPIVGFSPEVRERVISQYLATQAGRTRLAQSMTAPLRQRLDYQSVARRTFLVEQLPPGAMATYDRDPGVGEMAVTTGWDGNGSPVSDPPAWVRPGRWAFNKERDEYVQVLEIKCPHPGVLVHVWRSPEVARWVDVDYFYENWDPCEEPNEPLPFWDRLGEDELSP